MGKLDGRVVDGSGGPVHFWGAVNWPFAVRNQDLFLASEKKWKSEKPCRFHAFLPTCRDTHTGLLAPRLDKGGPSVLTARALLRAAFGGRGRVMGGGRYSP